VNDLTDLDLDSLDRTLGAVITCSFNAAAFAGPGGTTTENLRLLMTILKRSLPQTSRLGHTALYEGIRTILANSMEGSRQQVDGNVVENGMAISAERIEFGRGIAALLLQEVSPGPIRDSPIPGKNETESVRTHRAQAMLAYASSHLHDQNDREKATMEVNLWLNGERSGPVREILHEALASLSKQGKLGPQSRGE
jgi:hypothetical protein